MIDLGIGQLVAGRYRIISILGRGGMGAVYKALDTRIQRLVALKVLSFAPDSEMAEFFRREAMALSRLQHPNILEIYDVGEIDQLLYQAVQYVEGRSLQQIIAEGPLDPAYAIEIIRQVGKALAFAHQRRVIHRDVKPSNIMVSNDGRVLLLDFGLAIAPGETTLTRVGRIAGTPAYMAPEQAMGKPVDSRSDVFSLGIVAYECLTTRRPFSGGSEIETLQMLVEQEPEPPQRLNPRVPLAIEQVVLRSIEKDANNRFQTAGEFIQALNAAITANTMTAPAALPDRVASLTPHARGPERSRSLPILIVSLGIAGLLAAALFFWSAGSVKIAGLVALIILAILTNSALIRVIRRRNGPVPDEILLASRIDIPSSVERTTVQRDRTPTSGGLDPVSTVRCEVGHAFDPKFYAKCPYCAEHSRRLEASKESDSSQATLLPLPYVPSLIAPTKLLQQEPASMAWLLVLNGPLRGQQFRLTDRLTVGRAETCEICLADESVSRQHVRLEIVDKRFHIWDASSANGTFVNGVRLAEAQELRDRDEIRIGNMTMLFIQAITPEELTADAKRRLREFDSVWDQLTSSVRHDP